MLTYTAGELIAPPVAEGRLAENYVKRALEWKKMLTDEDSLTAKELAVRLKVSEAAVCLYLKLANTLDTRILTVLKDCQDNEVLKRFSLRKLVRLADSHKRVQLDEFKQLMNQAPETNVTKRPDPSS